MKNLSQHFHGSLIFRIMWPLETITSISKALGFSHSFPNKFTSFNWQIVASKYSPPFLGANLLLFVDRSMLESYNSQRPTTRKRIRTTTGKNAYSHWLYLNLAGFFLSLFIYFERYWDSESGGGTERERGRERMSSNPTMGLKLRKL